LNAGLLQENDGGVWGLAIVLAFLIFFPLGYVMLWRDKRLSRRRKLVSSVVVAVIVGLVVIKLMNG
jgi:succinate dehydrogenase hydrophobic anchor subunit